MQWDAGKNAPLIERKRGQKGVSSWYCHIYLLKRLQRPQTVHFPANPYPSQFTPAIARPTFGLPVQFKPHAIRVPSCFVFRAFFAVRKLPRRVSQTFGFGPLRPRPVKFPFRVFRVVRGINSVQKLAAIRAIRVTSFLKSESVFASLASRASTVRP